MHRVTELDAIRGLAALIIVAHHIWYPRLLHGWTRVDLFFIISGFLLTNLILRKSSSDHFFRTLFLRRLLRLGPPYFLVLAGVLLGRALVPHVTSLEGLPYYLTFTQNLPRYWGDVVPSFSSHFYHTWSLALEVQFYLIWPVVVSWVGRKSLIPAAIALIAVAVGARTSGFSGHILIGRCDSFGWGALLAALFADRAWAERQRRWIHAGLGMLALTGAAIVTTGMVRSWDVLKEQAIPWPGLSILATDLVYVGLVGLIIAHSGRPALGFLRSRGPRYLGTISYGIYLYHPLVLGSGELLGERLGLSLTDWPLALAMIGASVLIGSLSWELMERPLLRLRERFPYQAATDPTPRPEPLVTRGASPLTPDMVGSTG
jgi:peptidoglycan/LPS O-acetylase OafA/YrhL